MQTITKYDMQSAQSGKKRMLLHCCCAPCSSHCLEVLSKHFDITAYFYNPNITDNDEYIKRYDELKRFVGEVYTDEVDVFLEEHEAEVFLDMARGKERVPERGDRC